MQDLIMALDTKEREITDFMKHNNEEREKLTVRLHQLDEQHAQADADLRRLNKARNALRNPDGADMLSADARVVVTAPKDPLSPLDPYFPGRG